jgi:DNA-binding transcriptional MerR regulator
MIPEHLKHASFLSRKAGSFSGVPSRTIQSWAERGLIFPEVADTTGTGSRRLYSFLNCIEIGIIKALTESRLSLKFVEEALAFIRQPIPPKARDYSETIKRIIREWGDTMLHLQSSSPYSYLIVYFDKNNNPKFTYQSDDKDLKIDVSKEIQECDKVIVVNIGNIRNRIITKSG